MTTSTRCALAAALAAALTGCVAPDGATSEAEAPIIIDPSDPPPCSEWGCGLNAASMGLGLYFHELDISGRRPNDAGIWYQRVELDGWPMPLRLVVDRDQMFIETEGGKRLEGNMLVGAVLTLATPQDKFFVRIAAVGETNYWVGDPAPTPTYTFEYAPSNGSGDWHNKDFVQVCKPPPRNPDNLDPEQQGIDRAVALVFEGDRYDPTHKTVRIESDGWINIACAGSAVAKMELLRHTSAGESRDVKTEQFERQAMLKMLTDDICGTGWSFTVDGEDVRYMDRYLRHPFDLSRAGSVESIWDENGALCLDEPRRAREEWDVGDKIYRECRRQLPSCRPLVDGWRDIGYGISANP